MVRCRTDPTRWPLLTDVNNHLTELNPDVPDFQPGKIWKQANQSDKTVKSELTPSEEQHDLNWNQVMSKRKKPAKKKVGFG